MMFMGMDFTCGGDTLNYTPTYVHDIDLIYLMNAIFDELFISTNTKRDYTSEIPQRWDFDTVMHAQFNGNLHAGNVDYTAEEVSEMRIKRRIKGTYDWVTLFAIPIEEQSDFKFERFDRYARSNTEYEYALIPVINGIEGNLNTNSVYSKFEGVFLMERDVGYNSMLSVSAQINKNHPTLVVAPIHRKYPYVFGNGNTNYYSGTISAIFLQMDENCQFDFDKGWKYRHDFMEFLCNGRAKILKIGDGRMWMVGIIDIPSEAVTVHELAPTTTFSWVETDDCESGHALYENDFIDVDYAPENVI